MTQLLLRPKVAMVAILALFAIEVLVALSGVRGASLLALLAMDTVALSYVAVVATRSAGLWTTVMVAGQAVALACLTLGALGAEGGASTTVIAAWAAAHVPAAAAALPALVIRTATPLLAAKP